MSRYEIMQDKDGQNHHSENPEGQHQARRSTRVPDPSPKEREREGQSRGGARSVLHQASTGLPAPSFSRRFSILTHGHRPGR
ncbi:hypothetical protein RU639_011954 [Aspergillus parasiticus]